MKEPPPTARDREEALGEVLLAYEESMQAGGAPDRRELLRRHPELAAELNEYFASRDQIRRLTAPLRAITKCERIRTGLPPETDRPSGFFAPRVEGQTEPGRLGDFLLRREIGRGGMGIVYEAEQISLQRRVALKVLPFAAAMDAKQLQRFQNEARAAAQLHHPNIVAVFAVGCERGVHYFAMQLIEGQSLAALLEEMRALEAPGADGPAVPLAGPLAVSISSERSGGAHRYARRVAQLGIQAALALHYAHQVGIVHRDIKPANLLLDNAGDVRVTDFGLAHLQDGGGITQTGELVGTLRYMSPEQALGHRGLIDQRTDIYSLGATLYELLALQPVFLGRDRQELLRQVGFEEPRPLRELAPKVPAELETIVLKAMAKEPGERYLSAAEMAEDLRRFLECRPILARRPTLAEQAMKWSRRHRSVVVSTGVLLLLTLIGTAGSTLIIAWQHAQTKAAWARERQRAEEAHEERARAEEGFLQARPALDFITELSEAELAQKPGTQQLRKKLLAASLAYYQHFIEQHRNSLSRREELSISHWRLAKIFGELGNKVEALAELERAMDIEDKLHREAPANQKSVIRLAYLRYRLYELQGCASLALLVHPKVQEELRLTDEQLEKLARLAADLDSQRRELLRAAGPMSHEDRDLRFQEFVEANERAAAELLTEGQTRRLRQIEIQGKGPNAFGDPQVAADLSLTEEQLKEVNQELANIRSALWDYFYAERSARRAQPKPDEIRKAAEARLLKILTDEQRARWQAMIGPPFQPDGPLVPKGDLIPR